MGKSTSWPKTTCQSLESSPVGFPKSLLAPITSRLSAGSGASYAALPFLWFFDILLRVNWPLRQERVSPTDCLRSRGCMALISSISKRAGAKHGGQSGTNGLLGHLAALQISFEQFC